MAELILTDAEKAAELWTHLDDEALGKLLRKKIVMLKEASNQLDMTTTFAAAMILCCSAGEQGKSEVAFEIDGITQAGRDFGDWKVVAVKVEK